MQALYFFWIWIAGREKVRLQTSQTAGTPRHHKMLWSFWSFFFLPSNILAVSMLYSLFVLLGVIKSEDTILVHDLWSSSHYLLLSKVALSIESEGSLKLAPTSHFGCWVVLLFEGDVHRKPDYFISAGFFLHRALNATVIFLSSSGRFFFFFFNYFSFFTFSLLNSLLTFFSFKFHPLVVFSILWFDFALLSCAHVGLSLCLSKSVPFMSFSFLQRISFGHTSCISFGHMSTGLCRTCSFQFPLPVSETQSHNTN